MAKLTDWVHGLEPLSSSDTALCTETGLCLVHRIAVQVTDDTLVVAWGWCSPLADIAEVKLIIVTSLTADKGHVDWARYTLLSSTSVFSVPLINWLHRHNTHIAWFTVTATIPFTVQAVEFGTASWLMG